MSGGGEFGNPLRKFKLVFLGEQSGNILFVQFFINYRSNSYCNSNFLFFEHCYKIFYANDQNFLNDFAPRS